MAENKDDQGEKLRINLYPTREGSNCRITNFLAVKDTLLLELYNFILQRRGVPFENNRGNFSLPTRHTAETLENLLLNMGIEAEVTEPNSIENKTAQTFNAVVTDLNWREGKVGFGKHKETKWKDVPDDYLEWVCGNLKDGPAKSTALKERGYHKG